MVVQDEPLIPGLSVLLGVVYVFSDVLSPLSYCVLGWGEHFLLKTTTSENYNLLLQKSVSV